MKRRRRKEEIKKRGGGGLGDGGGSGSGRGSIMSCLRVGVACIGRKGVDMEMEEGAGAWRLQYLEVVPSLFDVA